MYTKKAIIKLRKPPVKPVRQKNVMLKKLKIEEGQTLREILHEFHEFNIQEDDIFVYYDDMATFGNYQYEMGDRYFFAIKGLEPEEFFNKRLEEYNKKLQQYNNWYDINRKDILAEQARRKQIELEKSKKEAEKLEKIKQQTIKKLEKELVKLKKGGV